MLIFIWILLGLAQAIGLILIGNLLLSRKRTSSLILWTLWLLLFPLLGIPLYWLLGTDRIRRKRHELREARRIRIPESKYEPVPDEPVQEDMLRFASRLDNNVLTRMTRPTILPSAQQYYRALEDAIDGAERYVHFQTYVWRPDDVGQRFLDALVRAAKRGVTVRLLVDELGSPEAKEDFFKPLVDAGGKFSWCLTVHPRRNRFFFNLRNHRKIQIVDNRTGFIGGMNIGREYEGRNEDVGPWEDMQIQMSGPVLNELQLTFLDDWAFATGEQVDDASYFGGSNAGELFPASVVRSGPDSLHESFLKTFIFLCNHAQKSLTLFTPYFAPDDAMLMAIELAAVRGVKVRLMIPTLNEHKYMVDIGRSYYEYLMEVGVEFWELPDAVNHAKLYRADDDWVLIGSPNLDIRSIRLNFEVGLLFQDKKTAEALDAHYENLFARAHVVDAQEFHNRSLKEKLKQGYVRLFAPLL